MSSDLGEHIAWLHRYLEMGFDRIYVHHVGRRQQDFIAAFGEHVLPEFGQAV